MVRQFNQEVSSSNIRFAAEKVKLKQTLEARVQLTSVRCTGVLGGGLAQVYEPCSARNSDANFAVPDQAAAVFSSGRS